MADSWSEGNSNTWIWALIVLCLVIFGYGCLYSTNTVSDPAFLAGEYLIYALFVWTLFHVAFFRKRGSKGTIVAFVAIYLVFFSGALISAQRQQQEASQAVSSIQQNINRLSKAPIDSNDLPANSQMATAQPPATKGTFGEIERFINEFTDRLVVQRKDYLLELEAIGWNSVLNAKRIHTDAALSESKVMITRAKGLVDKYEKKTAELMESTRERIRSLNVPQETKDHMVAGFENGLRKSEKQIDELWNLEKQVVQQVENIFFMLAASKKWVVEGERILFYSDSELDRFNSYIKAIQGLAEQQEQIQKSSLAVANKNMESLKKTLQR